MEGFNGPEQYRPISMWGYFGYTILFSLPVIGWVIALVLSFSSSNVNLRNFARSQFCCWIIFAILFAVLLFSGVLAGLVGAAYPAY